MVRGSLCYFCEGLGTVAPEVVEVTDRTAIIPREQFHLMGFGTRIDLDGRTRPRELEVKTSAEATGKTARTCRRELASKLQLCISNVP